MSDTLTSIISNEISNRYHLFHLPRRKEKEILNKTLIMDNINGLGRYEINSLILRKENSVIYEDVGYKVAYIRANQDKSINFSSLCSLMNINLPKVREHLKSYYNMAASNKMFYIGFGGMNSNLIQFIHHLTIESGYKGPKHKVIVIGNDNYEYHNLIRVYDYNLLTPENQLTIYNNSSNIIRGKNEKADLNMAKTKFSRNVSVTTDLNRENDWGIRYFFKDSLLVGAIDIESRKVLSERDCTLLSMLHNGYKGFMVQRQVPTGLETESYGKINAPLLMLNILKMTEVFLEYCHNFHINSIDRNEMDKTIFEFNSKDFLFNKFEHLDGNKKYSATNVDFKLNNRIHTIKIK